MNAEANTIIDRLGGTTAVARLFDIKPPSVHGWRSDGIPKYRLQFLRLARPDVLEGVDEQRAVSAAPQQTAAA